MDRMLTAAADLSREYGVYWVGAEHLARMVLRRGDFRTPGDTEQDNTERAGVCARPLGVPRPVRQGSRRVSGCYIRGP